MDSTKHKNQTLLPNLNVNFIQFQVRNIGPRSGLGHHVVPKKLKSAKDLEEEEAKIRAKFTTSDYVVPPKVPQLQLGPSIGPSRPYKEQEGKKFYLSLTDMILTEIKDLLLHIHSKPLR